MRGQAGISSSRYEAKIRHWQSSSEVGLCKNTHSAYIIHERERGYLYLIYVILYKNDNFDRIVNLYGAHREGHLVT